MALDCAAFYDAELRRHNERFRAAVNAGIRDRVLDIGCGAGQTTREAVRVVVEGSVVGVDVSAEMLDVARRRSAEEGLRNVGFEQGDAQVQAFPAAHFDLCISRFGIMFFADTAAAFANIGRAMRPGARLVLMVWQSRERNEWATTIQQALAPRNRRISERRVLTQRSCGRYGHSNHGWLCFGRLCRGARTGFLWSGRRCGA